MSQSRVLQGQSSPTLSNEGITDNVFLKPRNNFILNGGERNLQAPEMVANSCPGCCSGHSDDCRRLTNRHSEQETQRSWGTFAEHAPGHKLSCTRDIWISPRTRCTTKQVENIDYLNIDDTDDDISARRCTSPEIPFVKGERVYDGSSGRSVDFEKACKVRRTGKNNLSRDFVSRNNLSLDQDIQNHLSRDREVQNYHPSRGQEVQNPHPSRDQETQTLHETSSAFMNPTDSSRARDFIEMSRQNHSPGIKLQTGNSFQLLPTFIPVPSDPNGACFVSPTLGFSGGASAHAPFAPMPSTTHVFHPGNGSGQEHFVFLPSQMYSHVPHAVSTVYTSHVPPNVTTVGSHSGLPVILAPGRVTYNGPHGTVPNLAIPGPSFVPCSSPSASMRHSHTAGNVNTYRQYLMRPGAGCVKM